MLLFGSKIFHVSAVRGFTIFHTYPIAVHQMFFATSVLHVHLMQWDDENLVEQAVNRCDHVWASIDPNKVSGIFFLVAC